jgi:hypothetical protein
MRSIVIGLAALAFLPSAAAADITVRVLPPQAPKGFEQDHISKAALGGQEIRVWFAQFLDPDCSEHGAMQTQILQPPRHGQARVSEEPFYGNFPQNNVRYQCNTRKSPGRQVFYTSDANFHGHDKLVFQNATPDGRVRKWVVDIDVR